MTKVHELRVLSQRVLDEEGLQESKVARGHFSAVGVRVADANVVFCSIQFVFRALFSNWTSLFQISDENVGSMLSHLIQCICHQLVHSLELSKSCMLSHLLEHLLTVTSHLVEALLVLDSKADEWSDKERRVLLAYKLS